MNAKRVARYLAPNLITAIGLGFGLLALVRAHEGDFAGAGWLVVYAVLFDRLDGVVARLVRGTSELGVQLDSFADFLNFGLVPAYLMYVSLPVIDPGMGEGASEVVLTVACAAWVLAATFRLARYNITPEVDDPGPLKIFFGVPTTLAGGLLIVWYLALLKYSVPGDTFGGMRLFGDIVTPVGVWRYLPVALFVGAYLMASSLRMPKVGLMSSLAANLFIFANVGIGSVCGFLRLYPEYLVWPPTLWIVTFLVWGQLSPAARAMEPPPIFPPVDPPPGKLPLRPEDDLLPEGVDTTLDEMPPAEQD